jgi:hypothetical protein
MMTELPFEPIQLNLKLQSHGFPPEIASHQAAVQLVEKHVSNNMRAELFWQTAISGLNAAAVSGDFQHARAAMHNAIKLQGWLAEDLHQPNDYSEAKR